VPDDKDALLELSRVDQYPANAALRLAFGESRPIVDANVVRVYNRAFGNSFASRDDAAGKSLQKDVRGLRASQLTGPCTVLQRQVGAMIRVGRSGDTPALMVDWPVPVLRVL